jgi:hypothetical protein
MTPSPLTTLRPATRFEDIFDAWVFAAHDASEALSAWIAALPRDRRSAHTVYRAALDREESAAAALKAASRRRR